MELPNKQQLLFIIDGSFIVGTKGNDVVDYWKYTTDIL